MGFGSGDAVAWRRWWLPSGAGLELDGDGMLPDPSNGFLRFIHPDATVLADRSGYHAVIMLADAGMGKSFELTTEVARLRSLGTFVERIDLGEYLTANEVTDAVRQVVGRSREAGSNGLTLAFDGFDEPLFSVVNLAEVLGREIKLLDRGSSRVMITCRSSLWPKSLADVLSTWAAGSLVTLALAPLTKAQVRQAAATDVEDVEEFVSAVQRAGAGPLAARPITLRLMLAGRRSAELPRSRTGMYRLGTEAFAQEFGARRVERRQSGPPVDRVLCAARRLAAATLLTGRPRIVRRRDPLLESGQVALDMVVHEDVTADDLDAVFDSALLVGGADERTWVHRSVEEYLCAVQLGALPTKTAIALLADPGDTSRILPQLVDVAAWLAATDNEWFEWMLDHEPEHLVNVDLPQRDDEQRRRVGQTLLSHLAGGDVPDTRPIYRGFLYDGLDEDLLPLLAPAMPAAIRREAVVIAASAELRQLDRPIFELLVEAVQGHGPSDYDDDVRLACLGAQALKNCPDPELVINLKQMAANTSLPRQLRMSLLESLWPAELSTDDLMAAVTGTDRNPVLAGFGRRIFRLFDKTIGTGAVQPQELLPWFTNAGNFHDHQYVTLAGRAVLDAVTLSAPGESAWDAAVATAVLRLQVHWGFFAWTPAEVAGIDIDHRRRFARDVLRDRRDERAIAALIECEIVCTNDLDWWLKELADGLAGDTSTLAPPKSVLTQLAWRADDSKIESLKNDARALSVTSDLVEEIFGDAAIATRRTSAEASATETRRRESALASHNFSPERLDAALTARDFPQILHELEQQPEGPSTGWQPVLAWPALEEAQRQRAAGAAAEYLHRADLDTKDLDISSTIVRAYSILAAQDNEALDGIPPQHWLDWLPQLLNAPDGHQASAYARSRSKVADPQRTDEILIEQLRRDAFTGNGWRIHELAGTESRALSQAALDLTQDSKADPSTLSSLLGLAATAFPTEARAAALTHLREFRAVQNADAGSPTEAETRIRAVEAVVAVARMPELHTVFDEVFAALKVDPLFAHTVISGISADLPTIGISLSPEDLADLYLWARDAFPQRSAPQPGVAVQVNPVEEFPNDVLARLTDMPDPAALTALDRIAAATGDIWLRRAARLARVNARAAAWQPPTPSEVLAVIDEPARRILRTNEQLAQFILEEIDTLITDVQHDRALKSMLWHRQRQRGEWTGYVPLAEVELSDRLARLLERRLRPLVRIFRETETQPNLASIPADQPDLTVVAPSSDGEAATLIIEVKCNYNPGVEKAIEIQLGDRYLNGPYGSAGIYLVGFYGGGAWTADDPRHARSEKDLARLSEQLGERARQQAERGVSTYFRILNLSLDPDLPRPDAEPENNPAA